MFLSFFIFFCRLLSRRSGCCSLFFYPPLAWENGGRLCVGLFVSARRPSACWKLNSFLLKRTRQPKGKKRKEKKSGAVTSNCLFSESRFQILLNLVSSSGSLYDIQTQEAIATLWLSWHAGLHKCCNWIWCFMNGACFYRFLPLVRL